MPYICRARSRAASSAGRALLWHSRGQGFKSLAVHMSFKQHTWALVLSCAAVIILVVSVNGLHDMRVDGPIYTAQVESFTHGTIFSGTPAELVRLFKPLYPIVASTVFWFLTPANALLFMNCLFLLLLGFSSRSLLRQLNCNEAESTIGAIWVIAGYPILKYGLSISTDIGGIALATTAVAYGLRGVREKNLWAIVAASLIGTCGALAKETGALGLLFVGLTILSEARTLGYKQTFMQLAALCIPFAIVEGSFLALIYNKAPNFLDWYGNNVNQYAAGYHTLTYFVLTNGSTFNLLWLFACAGVAWLLITKQIERRNLTALVLLFFSAAPVLLWPIFISRILFIQFWWVIPLALFGLRFVANKSKYLALAALPVISSIVLFLVSGGGALHR